MTYYDPCLTKRIFTSRCISLPISVVGFGFRGLSSVFEVISTLLWYAFLLCSVNPTRLILGACLASHSNGNTLPTPVSTRLTS
ncbi:hypothetical protein V8B55DRAFT_1454395 [Mucor lusitanicus]|uniref:Uncharacterized protein n=1 Tax=Mucor circinelloides f. lusitanicus TaxID=29924 RepID=A0A8H4BPH0_MUCCL|nr:hypothetical protein FB192DRAFT_1349100 [Mucor lusitanicus]